MPAMDYPAIIRHLTDQLKDFHEAAVILRVIIKSGSLSQELQKRAEKALLECEKWEKGEKP